MQPETLLFIFDVTSIYANIPHTLGIDPVRFLVEDFPEETDSLFSEFILQGLKLILKNNSLHFDSQFFFLRTKGRAIATKAALPTQHW